MHVMPFDLRIAHEYVHGHRVETAPITGVVDRIGHAIRNTHFLRFVSTEFTSSRAGKAALSMEDESSWSKSICFNRSKDLPVISDQFESNVSLCSVTSRCVRLTHYNGNPLKIPFYNSIIKIHRG